MRTDRETCGDCRYYFEREAGDRLDPLGALCPGCDAEIAQGFCSYDPKDVQTFAARPACRRFERLQP